MSITTYHSPAHDGGGNWPTRNRPLQSGRSSNVYTDSSCPSDRGIFKQARQSRTVARARLAAVPVLLFAEIAAPGLSGATSGCGFMLGFSVFPFSRRT
jgi:hypothetical protein